jgi:hypothetical protein
MNFDLTKLTLDELSELEASIAGERSRRSGEPLEIWNGREGQIATRPPGGFILKCSWAIEDQSYADWYPTEEAAIAALEALAKSERRVVTRREGYWPSVDLTAPGCYPSRAWISTDDPWGV